MRIAAPLALFGVCALAGMASAATAFQMLGSDTLFDAIGDAIAQSKVNIKYLGTGSGNGETALVNHQQGVAPMSRNFKDAIINPTTGTHPDWAPKVANVLALDALVAVQKNVATKCANIQETQANGSVQPSHWLRYILGGVDGSGSAAACSHPLRLQAIAALSTCMHSSLQHFYRRDDNSGTTDTAKEKLGICNFCNNGASGTSKGGSPASNTNNADNDPIREACIPNNPAQFSPTPCRSTDNTLGFVVALSVSDPGSSDITTTIGARVANDAQGKWIGYAGREAAFSVAGATKFNINTVVPSVSNVRVGLYELSRRLFLQKGDLTNSMVVAADPTNEQAHLLAWATGIGQLTDPTIDPWYAANCQDADGNPLCGRPKMDPIMKARGFVTCLDNPNLTPTPPNLCGSQAPSSVAAVCTACAAAGGSCTTNADCCGGSCGTQTAGKCDSCLGLSALCAQDSDCCGGGTTTICDNSQTPPTCQPL